MRFTVKLSALLAMLLVGFSLLGGTGVGAQESPDAEEFDPADLEGIQHGVTRFYTMDFSAMTESMSTPGAEMEMPTGLLGVGAIIIEFDNDDNAEKGFDAIRDAGLEQDLQLENPEEFDVDLGNKSIGMKGSSDEEGMSMDAAAAIVQEDKFVFIVIASGSDVDVESSTRDFTKHVLEADGEGEGEFSEDGTSTGGLWDRFPKADDDLVKDLIPSDQILYPETDDAS